MLTKNNLKLDSSMIFSNAFFVYFNPAINIKTFKTSFN